MNSGKMKKLLKKLIEPIKLPFWWQDALIAVPRIVYGFLLTVSFGAPKFGMPWSPEDKNLGLFEVVYWFPTDVADFGGIFSIFPVFFAWMGAFSEAIGGLFWILGLQTKVFSFLIFCTMFVAVFQQQINNGVWNMLPAMGILSTSLFYIFLGSGRFGLDSILSNKL
jgi:putative oxidoreductase